MEKYIINLIKRYETTGINDRELCELMSYLIKNKGLCRGYDRVANELIDNEILSESGEILVDFDEEDNWIL